jgi:hypothetical protein
LEKRGKRRKPSKGYAFYIAAAASVSKSTDAAAPTVTKRKEECEDKWGGETGVARFNVGGGGASRREERQVRGRVGREKEARLYSNLDHTRAIET